MISNVKVVDLHAFPMSSVGELLPGYLVRFGFPLFCNYHYWWVKIGDKLTFHPFATSIVGELLISDKLAFNTFSNRRLAFNTFSNKSFAFNTFSNITIGDLLINVHLCFLSFCH